MLRGGVLDEIACSAKHVTISKVNSQSPGLERGWRFAQLLGMIESEKLLRGCQGAEKEEHSEMEEAQILPRETTLQKSLIGGLDQGFLR